MPIRKEKIETKINNLRGKFSLLSEVDKGSKIKERKRKQLNRNRGIKKKTGVSKVKEKLKQQIHAKAQRIRRYE